MQSIPFYVHLVFLMTAVAAIIIFCKAFKKSKGLAIVLIAWAGFQAVLALNGFFTVSNTIPPRFVLVILPPLIAAIWMFSTKSGNRFIDMPDLKLLALVHCLRIPVELTLYWLFLNKTMPELMTFHGRNLDIISGITAPFIYYFGFVQKRLSVKVMIGWNLLCLGILFITVFHGILSVPTPFQQFAFDQPNIAMMYFPFVWLPGIIVPIVYISHLLSIRILARQHKIIYDTRIHLQNETAQIHAEE